MVLDVRVPKVFEPLFTKDIALLEHAPVDCRAREAAHSVALSHAANGCIVAIIGGDSSLIDLWSDGSFKKNKFGSHTRYRVDSGELWLIGERNESAPAPTFNRVIVVGAHSFAIDPSSYLRTSKDVEYLIVGEKADRLHWTQEDWDEDRTLQLPAPRCVDIWPDLEGTGLEKSDPYYERKMLLADTEPKFDTSAFTVFARRRIMIRTDKPKELLATEQQRIASAQFGTPIVPFERSLLQRRYLAAKRRAVMDHKKPWYILVKYRRGGFTTTEQAVSYKVAVTRPNSQVVTLADTATKAARIFRMVMIMSEHDPSLRPVQISDSKTHLEWDNGSLFFIGTAGSRSFARGDTIQRAHGSECAFWCPGPHQLELVSDIKAGLIGAASYGEIVLESTPNRRNWYYQDYIDAKNGESEFTSIFVRWFDDPMNRALPGTFDPEEILETLSAEEIALMEAHTLDIAQIAFRRSQKRTFRHLFPQEFPEDDETCFLTSGTCFFDIEIVLDLMQRLGGTEHGQRRHLPGGYETIWTPPDPDRRYVAGCDTSEGLAGCDKNGTGILDFETGEQVAGIHGRFKPEKLAEYSADLCHRYNDALLGVERNNHGHAVLLALKNLGYWEPHYLGGPLYWHQDQNTQKDMIQDGVRIENGRAGWITSSSTRPIMLDGLQTAIESGAMKVNDREFAGECTTFTLQKGGKFEADSGCFDDSVIKWAIAWQMRSVRQPVPEILYV